LDKAKRLGWASKKQARLSIAWVPRYFMEHNNILYYFEKEPYKNISKQSRPIAKGGFRINELQICVDENGIRSGQPHCLLLYHFDRTMFIKFENRCRLMECYKILRKEIKRVDFSVFPPIFYEKPLSIDVTISRNSKSSFKHRHSRMLTAPFHFEKHENFESPEGNENKSYRLRVEITPRQSDNENDNDEEKEKENFHFDGSNPNSPSNSNANDNDNDDANVNQHGNNKKMPGLPPRLTLNLSVTATADTHRWSDCLQPKSPDSLGENEYGESNNFSYQPETNPKMDRTQTSTPITASSITIARSSPSKPLVELPFPKDEVVGSPIVRENRAISDELGGVIDKGISLPISEPDVDQHPNIQNITKSNLVINRKMVTAQSVLFNSKPKPKPKAKAKKTQIEFRNESDDSDLDQFYTQLSLEDHQLKSGANKIYEEK